MFEWDDEKDTINRIKHGIGFNAAIHIFSGIVLTQIDDRQDYGETREISIGLLEGQIVIVVVHTDRNDVTRIISARRANKPERKLYHDYYTQIIR